MQKRRNGNIITPPGLFIDTHEKKTADYLAVRYGWNVTFLLPNRAYGQKTPDILANGIEWEIKIPVGKSPRTLENIIRRALAHSPFIILDLRRMDGRIPTHRLIARVELRFKNEPFAKRIMVITRQETHIDFTR